MHRALAVFSIFFLASACGPAVKPAGHTKAAHEVEVEKTGSARRPSPVESEADKTPTTDGSDKPPTPQSAPRETLYADVPDGGRLVGKSGPVALEAWGRGGHWIAHCSLPPGATVDARGKPSQTPIIELTIGEKTEPIEAVLKSDDSGRFFVIAQGGKAALIDAVEGRRLDLTPLDPDLRWDHHPDHRAFAFTDQGLVLLSGKEGKSGYFIPLDGDVRFDVSVEGWALPIEFGARPVWRLAGHRGSFSGVTTAEGSSEKSWPVAASQAPVHRCQSPIRPFDAYERESSYHPDRSLAHVWAAAPSLQSKKKPTTIVTEEAPGFVFGFRDGWVRREDSGRLLFVRNKTQQQIASERCGARILQADEATGLFLASCEDYTPVVQRSSSKDRKKPKYRFDLYLLRPGFVRSLAADVARTGIDYMSGGSTRLFPIRPGATAALVDFTNRTMHTLEGDLQVLVTGKSQALLRRGKSLSLWSTKGEEPIDFEAAPLTPVLVESAAAAIGTALFVLDDELTTWELPAPPLAISDQGYALIPKKAASSGKWPEGPLLLVGPPPPAKDGNGEDSLASASSQ